jgi:uncharacterized protein YfaS (alpha-2-macroglobulin family)
VQHAVDTILNRQDEQGSIGLWRVGDDQLTDWLETYAVDFLWRAKERGYVVPDQALRLGRQALTRIVSYRNVSYDSYRNTQAFAFFALARQKSVDLGSLRYFHDTQLTGLYGSLAPAQLGAALALMGDKGRSANAFAYAAKHLSDNIPAYDYYTTPLRNLAAGVAAAAEAGASAYMDQVVQPMLAAMRPAVDLNTQEKAWLTLAAAAMAQDGKIEISVNDVVLAGGRGQRSLNPSAEELIRGYRIANAGDRPIWGNLIVHGTPVAAPPPLSAGITIQKTLFDLAGHPIDPSQLRQNDRVVVKIEGRLLKRNYGQLVVVDMLPAGIEVEGAVTVNASHLSERLPWLNELSVPAMRELRDDRVVSVVEPYDWDSSDADNNGQLTNGAFALAYIGRAVTPGAYALPGVAVEDMYKPAIMARSAVGSMTIAPAP